MDYSQPVKDEFTPARKHWYYVRAAVLFGRKPPFELVYESAKIQAASGWDAVDIFTAKLQAKYPGHDIDDQAFKEILCDDQEEL